MPYTKRAKESSEEVCRWAAFSEAKVSGERDLVDLSPTEQVSRGKELLQMLKPLASPASPIVPFSGADPSKVKLAGQGRPVREDANKVELVIRHTFIELVAPSSKPNRRRALTDSALDEVRSAQENTTCPTSPAEMSDVSTTAGDGEDANQLRLESTEWEATLATAGIARLNEVNHEQNMTSPFAAGVAVTGACGDPNSTMLASEWMMGTDASSWWMQGYDTTMWMPCPMDQSMMDPWACYAGGMPNEYAPMGQYLTSDPSEPCTAKEADAVQEVMSQEPKVDHELQATDFGDDDTKTTVMLRNLPSHFTRISLHQLLEDEGMEGTFDFLYMPMDFSSRRSLGYAIVNFASHGDAVRCWRIFEGYTEWDGHCENACEVVWSHPLQGLQAHVERYRNSPTMHDSIPEEWKPAVYSDGARIPFPAPTKAIKAPKTRTRAEKTMH